MHRNAAFQLILLLLLRLVSALVVQRPEAQSEQQPQEAQGPQRIWTQLRTVDIGLFKNRFTKLWTTRGGPSYKSEDVHTGRRGRDLAIRINSHTQEQRDALDQFLLSRSVDIWADRGHTIDVRLSEEDLNAFVSELPHLVEPNWYSMLSVEEMAESIAGTYPTTAHEDEGSSPVAPSAELKSHENAFFNNYQPLSVIVPWMKLMQSLYSSHVQIISLGESYEGRDIPALKIGVKPADGEERKKRRKTVFIPGGSHAREWISTSTVTYIAYELISGYGKSKLISQLLNDFDWILAPTVNPDGYAYTWEHDRLWRKNRQDTTNQHCPGMDLDRSWGFQWGGDQSSNGPCTEDYAGEEAFQAVEAKRIADWARNETESNGVEIVAFLDLHSYSQQVLYPYSYSCDEEPPSLENLEELALGLAKAIRLYHGAVYDAVSACRGNVGFSESDRYSEGERIAPQKGLGGGSALDWFYHDMKVQYAYQIKLRDNGIYGFLLPKENILPTGRETFEAVLYLGKFLLGEIGLLQEVHDRYAEAYERPPKEQSLLYHLE